jgi:hypothetical protein
MKTVTSPSYSDTPEDIQAPELGSSLSAVAGNPIFTPLRFLRTNFFMICVTTVVLFGWSRRGDNYLSAETGTGYVLGIIGGSLMLILLLYPISKRSRFLSRLVPLRYWFGIHMFLGIVGPVMILFHSNFQLGSLNSSFALISMLLVAVSGLIGRYIYTHIHHGLYGSRITIDELKKEMEDNHAELLHVFTMNQQLREKLDSMEAKVTQSYTGLTKSLGHVICIAYNAKRVRVKVSQLLHAYNKASGAGKSLPQKKIVMRSLKRYTLALRKVAAFKVYERLFSYWHILHMPLFIMMIVTAVVHIFAVHLY